MFYKNNYSSDTKKKFYSWLLNKEHRKEKEISLFEYWNSLEVDSDQQAIKSLEKVKNTLGLHRKRSLFYRPFLRVAAVMVPLLVLGVGGYLFFATQPRQDWVEISVPYGERKHVLLPDGSEAWVNAGSLLQYADPFREEERLIRLNGEAYFSVKKGLPGSFVVETKHFSVKALGTQFNVEAYDNEERSKATLNAGKIQIHTIKNENFILDPNQQLIYNAQIGRANVISTLAENVSGWKEGVLIFQNASFPEIIQTLERHFNITFKVTGSFEDRYSVKFSDNESSKQVINILSDVMGFSYTISGNKVRIRQK